MPMKRLVSLVLIVAVFVGVLVFASSPEVFAGNSKDQVCQGVNTASGVAGNQCGGGAADINRIISVILTTMSIIIGIIAVIMIMVGGFKYITAGGDSGNITSAKHTIIYALIGLVVVALAQFIVQFVLDKAT